LKEIKISQKLKNEKNEKNEKKFKKNSKRSKMKSWPGIVVNPIVKNHFWQANKVSLLKRVADLVQAVGLVAKVGQIVQVRGQTLVELVVGVVEPGAIERVLDILGLGCVARLELLLLHSRQILVVVVVLVAVRTWFARRRFFATFGRSLCRVEL
jgi:hypothetical protein